MCYKLKQACGLLRRPTAAPAGGRGYYVLIRLISYNNNNNNGNNTSNNNDNNIEYAYNDIHIYIYIFLSEPGFDRTARHVASRDALVLGHSSNTWLQLVAKHTQLIIDVQLLLTKETPTDNGCIA